MYAFYKVLVAFCVDYCAGGDTWSLFPYNVLRSFCDCGFVMGFRYS